jgi:hypothetical protein
MYVLGYVILRSFRGITSDRKPIFSTLAIRLQPENFIEDYIYNRLDDSCFFLN